MTRFYKIKKKYVRPAAVFWLNAKIKTDTVLSAAPIIRIAPTPNPSKKKTPLSSIDGRTKSVILIIVILYPLLSGNGKLHQRYRGKYIDH